MPPAVRDGRVRITSSKHHTSRVTHSHVSATPLGLDNDRSHPPPRANCDRSIIGQADSSDPRTIHMRKHGTPRRQNWLDTCSDIGETPVVGRHSVQQDSNAKHAQKLNSPNAHRHCMNMKAGHQEIDHGVQMEDPRCIHSALYGRCFPHCKPRHLHCFSSVSLACCCCFSRVRLWLCRCSFGCGRVRCALVMFSCRSPRARSSSLRVGSAALLGATDSAQQSDRSALDTARHQLQ